MSSQPTDPVPSPSTPKSKASTPGSRKRKSPESKEDNDGINKTLGTQANSKVQGVPASKCPSLSAFVRFTAQEKESCNGSIQKPRKVSCSDWDAIPVEDRTLWVIYRKALKASELAFDDFSFAEFKVFLRSQKEELDQFESEKLEKVRKVEESNHKKISAKAKTIDKNLREILKQKQDIKAGIIKAVNKSNDAKITQ
jgi:hypothetical protein